MENEEEIEEKIGKKNLEVLRKAINEAKLKIDKIRVIALKMKGTVYGTYDLQNRRGEAPVAVFNFMLETWYSEVLCEPGVDGYQKLVDILNHVDVAQKALALKMTPSKTEVLQLGLPESHYEIPLLDEKSKTGSLAHPSSQSGLTCASHATGKAILEILDSVGWDAEQQEIIDALIEKVQPSGQPENPDRFHNEVIKVKVTNKEVPGKTGEVDVQVIVQTRWGEMKKAHAFNTIPVNVDLHPRKIRMVLRWDMWDNSKNQYAPHAIYAKEYDTTTEKYSCINSWGNNEGCPQIHKSDIESIYYVTIKQVNM